MVPGMLEGPEGPDFDATVAQVQLSVPTYIH